MTSQGSARAVSACARPRPGLAGGNGRAEARIPELGEREPTPRASNEVGAGEAELAAYAKSQDKAFRKAFPAIGKSVYGYLQASGAAPKRVSDYMRELARRR